MQAGVGSLAAAGTGQLVDAGAWVSANLHVGKAVSEDITGYGAVRGGLNSPVLASTAPGTR